MKLFIEIVEEAYGSRISKSDCRKATDEEIASFQKHKNCNHSNYEKGDQILIYDKKKLAV